MNSVKKIKFKRLIQTDWLEDKEAEFALSIINIVGSLDDAYDEFVKMSSKAKSNEHFVVAEEYTIEDHFTLGHTIMKKIDSVEFTNKDVLELREL